MPATEEGLSSVKQWDIFGKKMEVEIFPACSSLSLIRAITHHTSRRSASRLAREHSERAGEMKVSGRPACSHLPLPVHKLSAIQDKVMSRREGIWEVSM